uniref:Uncharacterized protein n=1 Tax=Kwoniella bestiolae CBS 10118 TaxID=1296100 RepID=A0A1B9FY70_9TREE|nr:hypothetical protein I302_06695 [Kwoniella bestiolae CBS 10118]OCF23712.1 hypothetical protein I302_06695 [Kwoniella bestiolae CBS 10118]
MSSQPDHTIRDQSKAIHGITPLIRVVFPTHPPSVLAIKFSSLLSTSTTSAQTSLQSQGITYNQGKMSIKTDRAAPSRDEYILNTQAAFERGGKMMKAHKDAFSFKKGGGGSGDDSAGGAQGQGVGSGVDTG